MEVPWSMLGEMIRGRKVVLQLADGETVKGRVSGLAATSLVIKVKKTSAPVAYPKGETQIPRESVTRIEMRRHSANKRALLGIGAFAGTLVGSVFALYAIVAAQGGEGGSLEGRGVGILVGISGAVAAAVYSGAGQDRITIEIQPNSPGEQDKKENAPATTGAGALAGAHRTGAGGY